VAPARGWRHTPLLGNHSAHLGNHSAHLRNLTGPVCTAVLTGRTAV